MQTGKVLEVLPTDPSEELPVWALRMSEEEERSVALVLTTDPTQRIRGRYRAAICQSDIDRLRKYFEWSVE
jgi:hypothetical protein